MVKDDEGLNYNWMPIGLYLFMNIGNLVSSCLSLLGSFTIIYVVVRHQKTNKLYHRLVCFIGCMDIGGTLGLLMGPLWAPYDITQLPWSKALGTTTSCDITMIFLNFFTPMTLANIALSVYFLMTIRYGKTERQSCQVLEPYLYVASFISLIIYPAIAIPLDLMNPDIILGSCVPGVYPPNCNDKDIPCIRASIQTKNMYSAVAVIGTVILLPIGLISVWLVYWTVRQKNIQSDRFNFPGTNSVSEQRLQRLLAMRTQCILYSVPYLVIAASMGVFSVISSAAVAGLTDSNDLYTGPVIISLAAAKLLSPSLGFFNALIYMRPRLLTWRQRDASWIVAFHNFLVDRPIPPLPSRRRLQGGSSQNQTDGSMLSTSRLYWFGSFLQSFRLGSSNRNTGSIDQPPGDDERTNEIQNGAAGEIGKGFTTDEMDLEVIDEDDMGTDTNGTVVVEEGISRVRAGSLLSTRPGSSAQRSNTRQDPSSTHDESAVEDQAVIQDIENVHCDGSSQMLPSTSWLLAGRAESTLTVDA